MFGRLRNLAANVLKAVRTANNPQTTQHPAPRVLMPGRSPDGMPMRRRSAYKPGFVSAYNPPRDWRSSPRTKGANSASQSSRSARRAALAGCLLLALGGVAKATKLSRITEGWFIPNGGNGGVETFFVRNVVNGYHNDRVCGEVVPNDDGYFAQTFKSGGARVGLDANVETIPEAEMVVRRDCE